MRPDPSDFLGELCLRGLSVAEAVSEVQGDTPVTLSEGMRGEGGKEEGKFGVEGVAVRLVPWATWAAHLASSLHLVLPAGRPTIQTI